MRYMTNFERVQQFHKIYGQRIGTMPELADKNTQDLRISLIEEELRELKEGLEKNDVVATADALTDLLYVVYGAGVSFGIDLDACFIEVHRSNLSKLDDNGKPIYREDGKVLKGPNYSPPDLKKVLDV